MIFTYNYIKDGELDTDLEKELRSKIEIGMYATLCCHMDMFEIKNLDDINDIVENAEDNYTIGTFEEISKLGHD